MDYSIIVPAWNEAAFLGETLDAVKTAMAADSRLGELIVVDNNSIDDTATIARDAGAIVVFEPVNQIARARNAGAARACGSALIFTDADTRISPALLRTALDNLDSGRVVGGGALIAPDKPVATAARRAMHGWNALSRRLSLAAGCFVYCRRDAFDAIGGFSTRVYAGEEIFLSRQLKRWAREQRMTFRIIIDPKVVTSIRKLEWYTPAQLARQAALVLIPGAVFSKTLCGSWYDKHRPRKRL